MRFIFFSPSQFHLPHPQSPSRHVSHPSITLCSMPYALCLLLSDSTFRLPISFFILPSAFPLPNSPSPSRPIPHSCFFPTFSSSHLHTFLLSRLPTSALCPMPHALCTLLTFSSSQLLTFYFSTFRIPTSAFRTPLILNQIWFKNHIWFFLRFLFRPQIRSIISVYNTLSYSYDDY